MLFWLIGAERLPQIIPKYLCFIPMLLGTPEVPNIVRGPLGARRRLITI
jgi:hypothetical protein